MWRNYLTVGFRALAGNKTYAAINILGLALGLAACMLILLFVRYELSYDAALLDADRVFQLQEWPDPEPGEPAGGQQMTSIASATALRKDFPQIEKLVYVGNNRPTIIQDGEATTSDHFVYVDGPIFDILQLPFLRGDRRTALAGPGSLVLTQSEAGRRFGSSDPIGRTLTLLEGGKSVDYRVTGVVADPSHSHLALSIIARYDPATYWARNPDYITQWLPKNGWAYLKGWIPPRSPARWRPGRSATSPTRRSAASATIPARIATGSW
jgi:putative ABC transport system permease protein